jgi:hypothetical protein
VRECESGHTVDLIGDAARDRPRYGAAAAEFTGAPG